MIDSRDLLSLFKCQFDFFSRMEYVPDKVPKWARGGWGGSAHELMNPIMAAYVMFGGEQTCK